MATGEEEEVTHVSILAKLFVMESNAWKERGVGNFKLNASQAADRKYRFVMRAKGSQKLILNSPVLPSSVPKDVADHSNRLTFTAVDHLDGTAKLHTLKVKSAAQIDDLYRCIVLFMSTDVSADRARRLPLDADAPPFVRFEQPGHQGFAMVMGRADFERDARQLRDDHERCVLRMERVAPAPSYQWKLPNAPHEPTGEQLEVEESGDGSGSGT